MKLKKKALDEYFYMFMSIFLGLILVYGCFFGKYVELFWDLILNAPRKGYFLPVLWLYVFYIIVAAVILRSMVKSGNRKKILFFIFILAMFPRLILCTFNFYVPDNDFRKYYSCKRRRIKCS